LYVLGAKIHTYCTSPNALTLVLKQHWPPLRHVKVNLLSVSVFLSLKDCPTSCFSCESQTSCRICNQGYTLSHSLCVSLSYQQAQEEATHAISSVVKGIGSVLCVGSSIFPLSALVSKTVQNTRYLNLSVTSDLTEIYHTWQTDLIPWEVPNAFSNEDHFKSLPSLFARYDLGSSFLVNFWPTLLNIGIGFTTFIICFSLQKFFHQAKYEGWAHFLVQKLVARSLNFSLVQAYACLDDIFFYLVLDAKTNSFNSFFSWASIICAVIFLALGCLLAFFNFWTVNKYQSIKTQGVNALEAFNERNKYWELFYSDFNDDNLWCQSFFAILVIRSALSSFIITVLYDYPLMQTPYLVIMDGAIISFLYFQAPFNTFRGKLAQYYYETIALLVHICTFSLSLQDSSAKPSETIKLIFSTAIIYLNTALITGALGFMFIELYKTISEKERAAQRKQGQNKPEDHQETQSLTRTAAPLQPSETDAQKEQDWSIEKLSFNGNVTPSNFNVESSQVLESNFHADNSRELDIYPSNRISQQRDQITTSIFIRRKIRIINPK